VNDLATELLRAFELALAGDELALHAQLDRVEQAMADAIDEALGPDDSPLEAVA
jgi:hypothetical protein